MRPLPPPERPLGPAILRVAGWPIETLDPLRAPALAARVDAWIAHGDALAAGNAAFARRLHALVPGLAEPAARRAALALKRHLHAGLDPVPEVLAAPLRAALGPDLDAMCGRLHDHADERTTIEAAHAAELDRAGEALARLTAEPRFARALCLASPSCYTQARALCAEVGAGSARERASEEELGAVPCRSAIGHGSRREPVPSLSCGGEGTRPSRRSRQRLRATLHRYLMRAVGRATPSGLWAGIALEAAGGAEPGAIAVAPAPARTRASPDLALFVPALEALSLRHLDTVGLSLNPTLEADGEGRVAYAACLGGAWQELRIEDHAALQALRARHAPGDRLSLAMIAAALREKDAELGEAAPAIAGFWLRHGLLLSDLGLPAHYADPWQGLDAILAGLPESERPAWQACRAALRRQAETIEAGLDAMAPDDLRALLDAGRAALAALLARDRLPAPERDALVIDRTAPFRFALSDAHARRIAAGVRAAYGFDRFGLGAIETRIGVRETFGEGPATLGDLLRRPEPPPQAGETWEARILGRASPAEAAEARAAFARWEAALAGEPGARALTLPLAAARESLPPGSALVLAGRGGQLRIGGITAEPCFFYGRFAPLFRTGQESDPFRTWAAAGLAAIERRRPDLRGCDLAIRNPANPNVAARPRLSEALLDPLGEGGRRLRAARIGRDGAGRPILRDGVGSLLLPSARSAAALAGRDRGAALLAAVSGFLGRPPLIAPMPRLAREVADWHHLPRLLLGEVAIGPERWSPPDDLGRALAAARGAERFVLWRRYAGEAGLPGLVHAFHGRQRTETLTATDSALAIECLALDLKAHGPRLRLQEVWPGPEEGIVRDAQGRRYLAELAVAWQADPAFWDDYGAPNPEIPKGSSLWPKSGFSPTSSPGLRPDPREGSPARHPGAGP